MIITCPSCTKRYAIPDELIGENGKEVKCSSCEKQWFFTKPERPDGTLETLEELRGELLGASNQKRPESQGKKKSTLARYAFPTLGFSTITFLGALLVCQDAVIRSYPPSKEIYVHLGLYAPKNFQGLKLHHIHSNLEEHGGQKSLVVSGILSNGGKKPRAFKGISFTVLGDCKKAPLLSKIKATLKQLKRPSACQLMNWNFEPTDTKLSPNEHFDFESRAPKAIEDAQSITIKLY